MSTTTDSVSALACADAHCCCGAGGGVPGRRQMSLSPSRAADFRDCPLKYRYRAIDRLPESSSTPQVCGLVFHGALERLYGLPPVERTREAADGLVDASVAALVAERPDTADLAASDDVRVTVSKFLDSYFGLEDPRRLAHVEVEQLVQVVTDDGVPLKGFIDRLDVAPDGSLRVNDYKGKAAPSEKQEESATYQLKLYALALWISRGIVPASLRLLYVKSTPKWLELTTSEDELRRFSKRLTALWAAILRAGETGDFRPRESFACRWCSFHEFCPKKGGELLPYPGWPGEEAA